MKKFVHLGMCCLMVNVAIQASEPSCEIKSPQVHEHDEARTERIVSSVGEVVNGLVHIIKNPHEKPSVLHNVGKMLAGILSVAANAVQRNQPLSPEEIDSICNLLEQIHEPVNRSLRPSLTSDVKDMHDYLRSVSIDELNEILNRTEEAEQNEELVALEQEEQELQSGILASLQDMLHNLFAMIHDPENQQNISQSISEILENILNVASQALKYEYLTSKDAEERIALYLDTLSEEISKKIKHLVLQTALNVRGEGTEATRRACCTSSCKTSCCKTSCSTSCCTSSCKTSCCKPSCKPCCRTEVADDEKKEGEDEEATRKCSSCNKPCSSCGCCSKPTTTSQVITLAPEDCPEDALRKSCCSTSCKDSCKTSCKPNCSSSCKPCCKSEPADDEDATRKACSSCNSCNKPCSSCGCSKPTTTTAILNTGLAPEDCPEDVLRKSCCSTSCKDSCKTSCKPNCSSSCKPCCKSEQADDEKKDGEDEEATRKCSSCNKPCSSCGCCSKPTTTTQVVLTLASEDCPEDALRKSCCSTSCKDSCKTSCKPNCSSSCKPCCKSEQADDEKKDGEDEEATRKCSSCNKPCSSCGCCSKPTTVTQVVALASEDCPEDALRKSCCSTSCKDACKTSCKPNCSSSCKPCCKSEQADDEKKDGEDEEATRKCSSCNKPCSSCGCCSKPTTTTQVVLTLASEDCPEDALRKSCCSTSCKDSCKTSCKPNCSSSCKPCCKSELADDEKKDGEDEEAVKSCNTCSSCNKPCSSCGCKKTSEEITRCGDDCTCDPCRCTPNKRDARCGCNKPKPKTADAAAESIDRCGCNKPKPKTQDETTRDIDRCGCSNNQNAKQPEAKAPSKISKKEAKRLAALKKRAAARRK